MNEKTSLTSRLVSKTAEMFSDALIHQADQGVKFSGLVFISEAEFPVDLMREDAE
jgi:hypothetical protein